MIEDPQVGRFRQRSTSQCGRRLQDLLKREIQNICDQSERV